MKATIILLSKVRDEKRTTFGGSIAFRRYRVETSEPCLDQIEECITSLGVQHRVRAGSPLFGALTEAFQKIERVGGEPFVVPEVKNDTQISVEIKIRYGGPS